jgi:hypothetical protein
MLTYIHTYTIGMVLIVGQFTATLNDVLYVILEYIFPSKGIQFASTYLEMSSTYAIVSINLVHRHIPNSVINTSHIYISFISMICTDGC